jgi:hypothetical protein
VVSGVMQPLMTIVFGQAATQLQIFSSALSGNGLEVIDEFQGVRTAIVNAANSETLQRGAILIILGFVKMIACYGYLTIFSRTSERIVKRIREQYLRATLRREVCTPLHKWLRQC